jgi:Dolichyl-phosphate-mannose-protein mannosyltransferase
MSRLQSGLGWIEERALSGRAAFVLFAAGLAVYAVQSVAVPLVAGRDLGTYLRYYAQFGDGDPVFPMAMLYRTPVAPFVVGVPLDLGGAALAQAVLGVLFAASVVAWSATAAVFGPRAALVTAVALLAYPGYGILFHALSSDAVFAAAFAGWAYLVSRATVRSSPVLFAAAGAGAGLLALVRPGNQVLLAFAVFPLVLAVSWRRRVECAASFLAAGVAVLGLWVVHNGVRYGDYTVARGGSAFVPFFRMYVADHIVAPENGRATQELAEAVERHLLPEEPYRSYGITRDEFFDRGSIRMHEDLVNLSDRVWGWDSGYEQLRDAAWEALRAHPGAYARGVASTVWDELSQTLFSVSAAQAAGSEEASRASSPPAPSGLPQPTEGEPIPSARRGLYTTTPDGSVDELWTSPTEHRLVFADPADSERYDELERRVSEWLRALPAYETDGTARLYLNRASRWFPRPWMWLAVGLVAIAVRRPDRWSLAVELACAALAVVVFTALGISTVVEFAIPVVPAFVVLAAAGLVGRKRHAGETPAC